VERLRLVWLWLTKSGKRSARIPLEPANPRQNSIASIKLDLPDPLGPEMTVNPGNKGTAVVPPKDLKLVSSSRLIYTETFGDRRRRMKQSSLLTEAKIALVEAMQFFLLLAQFRTSVLNYLKNF
jgi:hypothetical protein